MLFRSNDTATTEIYTRRHTLSLHDALPSWNDIGFPGDIQPRGYSSEEVERSDGRDPVDDTGVVAAVLKLLGAL